MSHPSYFILLETEFPFYKQIMQMNFRPDKHGFRFSKAEKPRKTPKKWEKNNFFKENQKNLKKGVDIML